VARAEAELAALLGHLSLRLRVGTFQAAALHLLPSALTALRHRHPDADVSVMDVLSGRGADEISAGRLDVVRPGGLWAVQVPHWGVLT
jgi:DNA-binding transcriptional LysR family regulator